MEVECNQINFIFFINNCSESIVQSISFHNELSIRNLMSEDGSRGECSFERVESIMIEEVELLRNILSGEVLGTD